MEKFAQKNPSCVAYDEKLHFYHSVAEDIAAQTQDKEVEFAVLHMAPLARSLRENASSWVSSLGKLLNESAKDSLVSLDRQLDVITI